MRTRLKIALVVGALALAALPAMALATKPAEPGGGHGNSGAANSQGAANGQGKGPHYEPAPTPPPGPKAGLPEQARAYGRVCQEQGFSKKHVKGQKGTPFSQCVTAMAKAATNEKMAAKRACKGLSKKHVKGQKGTPFSRCVVAANKVRKEQRQQS
jgi:hypothetical protein